jgi:hypothetical protein
MIVRVTRPEHKMRWLYFVHFEGRAVIKCHTDAPAGVMRPPGYRACTYREYLRVRQALRRREKKELLPCVTQ